MGAERFRKRILKATFERLKLVLYVMQAKWQQQRLTTYNYQSREISYYFLEYKY